MLSGKEFKAKCGVMKPVEFDCKENGWDCRKCFELMDFCWDIKIRDLKEAEAQLIMLPKKIEDLKKDKEEYSEDVLKIKRYLKKFAKSKLNEGGK